MVRSKKNTVLARGGDKAVQGGAFYANEAARPALQVLDTALNTTEPPAAKTKEKRPAKPKTAAVLYAENECEAMMIQSGLHENQSKLAIKTCKDDALAAFKNGEVEQSLVDKYTEKEQAEREKYEKQVEQWNEAHPDETLVIGKNGTAVRSQANPERQKMKEEKAAVKAAKKELGKPGTTKELKAVSARAAEKLKKLQAKQESKGKKEEEDVDMEEDDDEDGESEDVVDDESEAELSDDDEEEEEPEAPVKGKDKKKMVQAAKGGKKADVKKAAEPQKNTKAKAEAPSRRRKAEAEVEKEEKPVATKSKKKGGKAAAAKTKEPEPEAESEEEKEEETPAPKVAKSKATAKKADAKKAEKVETKKVETKKVDTKKVKSSKVETKKADMKKAAAAGKSPASKPTRASKRVQQEVAYKAEEAQPSKKKPAKPTKAADDVEEEQPPKKSRLSRVRKNVGPTMPKPSPAKSGSAYTGNYDVPSDDE